MPFTPFHLGFALILLGLFPFLDPVALALGTILIDIEAILYLLFHVGQLHGILHTLVGVFVLFLPITFVSWITYKYLKGYKIYRFNWLLSILSSIIGLLSHLFFDTIIYPEMKVLYPFTNKTGILYGLWSSSIDYWVLTIMGLVGVVLIAIRYVVKQKKKQSGQN